MAEAEVDFEEGPYLDAEEDEGSVVSSSEYLMLEEVIRRRSSRAKRLMKLYKAQYWGLVEEMRSKYRKFFLKHGKGGWKEDWEVLRPASSSGGRPPNLSTAATTTAGATTSATTSPTSAAAGGAVLHAHAHGAAAAPHPPGKAASETLHCAYLGGCKSKPLALSVFCLAHILHEPRQHLYAPCAFVTNTGGKGAKGGAGAGGGGGEVQLSSSSWSSSCRGGGVERCGVPVLKAMRGPFCPLHRHQAAIHARAWRRSALGLGTLGQPMTGKGIPKLHLILNEYVRAIQHKRRALRRDALIALSAASSPPPPPPPPPPAASAAAQPALPVAAAAVAASPPEPPLPPQPLPPPVVVETPPPPLVPAAAAATTPPPLPAMALPAGVVQVIKVEVASMAAPATCTPPTSVVSSPVLPTGETTVSSSAI